MIKYILKLYRWIFSLCEHDWKIVNTKQCCEYQHPQLSRALGIAPIEINKQTKIYEVCQKCKETRIRFIKGYWKKEDLI